MAKKEGIKGARTAGGDGRSGGTRVSFHHSHSLVEDYDTSAASEWKRKNSKKRKSGDFSVHAAESDPENGNYNVIDSNTSRKILRISQRLSEEEKELINGDDVHGNHIFNEQHKNLGNSDDPHPNSLFYRKDDVELSESDSESENNWNDDDSWNGQDDNTATNGADEENMEAGSFKDVSAIKAELETFDQLYTAEINQRNGINGERNLGGAEINENDDDGDEAMDIDDNKPCGINLSDLILEKIAAHEAMLQRGNSNGNTAMEGRIPEKIIKVYAQVADLLSRQNIGKLPKPFLLIPTLPLGMQRIVLDMCEPMSWTPYVSYMATKVFVSKSNEVAEGFMDTVLRPLFLHCIARDVSHKLHQTMYRALKKALYRPSAFFKGFLFPLLEEGCTMREAHIVASVLARVSVPVLHSAVALMRLTEIAASKHSNMWNTKGGSGGGAGPVNWCIKVLIDKKYALPYQVIDALVFHFLRFRGTNTLAREKMRKLSREESLPLLWHQSFLIFAQRYRDDITEDQREALLDLLLVKGHPSIGPEIRRELLAGRGRRAVDPNKLD